MMMTTLAGVERPFVVGVAPLFDEPTARLPLAERTPAGAPFLPALLLGFFDMPERSLRVHTRPAGPTHARRFVTL